MLLPNRNLPEIHVSFSLFHSVLPPPRLSLKSSSELKALNEKSSSELKAQISQLDGKFSAFNESYTSLKATTERVIVEVDNLERRR